MWKAFFIALAVILLWWLWWSGEGFENKAERATAIREWFRKDKTPTFVEYRDQLTGDIIEYTDLRRICENPNSCTEDKIMTVI